MCSWPQPLPSHIYLRHHYAAPLIIKTIVYEKKLYTYILLILFCIICNNRKHFVWLAVIRLRRYGYTAALVGKWKHWTRSFICCHHAASVRVSPVIILFTYFSRDSHKTPEIVTFNVVIIITIYNFIYNTAGVLLRPSVVGSSTRRRLMIILHQCIKISTRCFSGDKIQT